MHNDPVIKLEESEIPVLDEYKFLGVIFGKKLTFIYYIKYLEPNASEPNSPYVWLLIENGELTDKGSLTTWLRLFCL